MSGHIVLRLALSYHHKESRQSVGPAGGRSGDRGAEKAVRYRIASAWVYGVRVFLAVPDVKFAIVPRGDDSGGFSIRVPSLLYVRSGGVVPVDGIVYSYGPSLSAWPVSAAVDLPEVHEYVFGPVALKHICHYVRAVTLSYGVEIQ